MVIYLVMKNNLKRTFTSRFTYLVMILIPIAIGFLSIIAGSVSDSNIRVGVICNEKEYRELSDTFKKYPQIRYERAERNSEHTDLITGKYQYVIDMTEKGEYITAEGKNVTAKDRQNIISTIIAAAKQNYKSAITQKQAGKINQKQENIVNRKQERNSEELSQTDRTFALLLAAYMIIASVYATTMIKDKKNKTMERFCIAGFHKSSYRHGYFVSTALIMLCQLFIAVLLLAVFDCNFSVSFERAAELILFMAAVSSIFGVGIASILKSDLSANIMASSLVVILSLLGGTFVSINQMPEVIKCLSIISPVRWMQFLP